MFYSCTVKYVVPQGDTDKNDKSSIQNGCKGHQKSQICNGTISQNKCHKKHILHGKFHVFFKNCTTLMLTEPKMTGIYSYQIKQSLSTERLYVDSNRYACGESHVRCSMVNKKHVNILHL